jgi:hypothetical protein
MMMATTKAADDDNNDNDDDDGGVRRGVEASKNVHTSTVQGYIVLAIELIFMLLLF